MRFALQLLVLTNLAFVSITHVVDPEWLVIFFALTGAALSLSMFADRLWFRTLWNCGLFVIFTILVNDATKTGVEHMLEDGLILATFCQVHLLNNLGKRQSPDLLFFNSFLIALVTCFFSSDVVYLLVFVPWVFCQLAAMNLATIVRDDRVLTWKQSRMLVRQTVSRTILTLSLTGLAFVFVPRDFSREGFATKYLQRESDDGIVGFSEEVRLGAMSAARNDRVVASIERQSGSSPASGYLRGATLTTLRGNRWTFEDGSDETLLQAWTGRFIRRGGEFRLEPNRPATSTYTIRILDQGMRRLLLPTGTTSLRAGHGLTLDEIDVHGDLTASIVRTPLRFAEPEYSVSVGPERPVAMGQSKGAIRRAHLQRYLTLPLGRIRSKTGTLVAELMRDAGATRFATQREEVMSLTSALSHRRTYALPGETGAARSLEDFLDGASGHCEYFASALILVLRARRIPCRMVTGFHVAVLGDERIDVRSRDAHAWVEVFDSEDGWYTADPTPSATDDGNAESEGLFARIGEGLDGFWKSVTSMSADGRIAAIDGLLGFGIVVVSFPITHPGVFALLVMLAVAWILVRRSGRRGRDSAIRDYELAVRRTGLVRGDSESPREFLCRAQLETLDASLLEGLRAATVAHERRRYAGSRS
ncbi:MAG: DUF3488 domain-containing protein [Planctomycetes bacterium]|nr:DUF3488 domain-containing protein [Planctomycetota bacterium]MCB9891073.1 DUF3488 domain-containing protein [Planctomycetota bacterium]